MLSIIGGLIAGIVGILLWIGTIASWFSDFAVILRGCIPPALILGGIIAVIAGFSSIKDKIAEKKASKEEEKKPEASAEEGK